MAGIRTTTVTNCFIRLAAREPFHLRLAPQGRYSSWLYALFSSTSVPSSSASPSSFNTQWKTNVTRGWMNGWTRILAAGGRCFFEIEPNHLTSRSTATRLYFADFAVFQGNQSIELFPFPRETNLFGIYCPDLHSFCSEDYALWVDVTSLRILSNYCVEYRRLRVSLWNKKMLDVLRHLEHRWIS